MTTPGSHNDTYAESYHRDFFANFDAGVPREQCAGPEGHNTASIGGFVHLVPAILSTLDLSEELAVETIEQTLALTHTSGLLARYAGMYASMMREVILDGTEVRPLTVRYGHKIGFDVAAWTRDHSELGDTQAVAMLGAACYIESSFLVVLVLAYRYLLTICPELLYALNYCLP